MFIKENIMLAIAGLRSNKMRALLTMLGIIIGIASVIGVVSVGNSMTSSVTSSMASMGASNITVNVQEKSASTVNQYNGSGRNGGQGGYQNGGQGGTQNGGTGNSKNGSQGSSQGGNSGQGGAGGFSGGGLGGMMGGGAGRTLNRQNTKSAKSNTAKDTDLMTMEQINTLQDEFSDNIEAISLSENGSSGKVKSDTSFANVSTVGTNDGYQDVKSLEITNGRYLSQKDIDEEKNVAVVSDKLVSKIFGDNVDPINQKIKVYTSNAINTYTIVGVYKYKSQGSSRTSSDDNLTTDLYIPVTVVKKTETNKNYQMFTIKAKDGVDVQAFTTELSTYLSKLYAKNNKFEAQASNMESMLESATSMMSSIKMAISAIAGISLMVGGIGVMNIMLVSVTERTREIGTRKALGAKGSHIQMQFIVESVIICAIGGILGILLGLGIGFAGSKAMGYAAVVSPTVILISFGFSMFIGVFFGYYPAKKAAQLDPIEALRYE